MQESLADMEEQGANLVAISPLLPKYSKQVGKNIGLGYDILSDERNEIVEEFGLKFQFPDYLKNVYLDAFGVDLERFNGDDSWTLPMPARYVVGQDGIIKTADFDPDYTFRPEPSKTVEDLKALK